jgi:MYXO-CTERM domain-containing protein
MARRRVGLVGRLRGSLLALAAGGLTACSSQTASPEQVGSTAEQISGGVVDLSHESVFLLVAHHRGSSSLCTSTLLAPNLLLTARHCVSSSSDEVVQCGAAVLGEPWPADTFFATNDPQPTEGSPVFTAAEVHVPDEGMDTCGYDVALLVLNENVPTDVAQPSVPRIDREVMPGESYTAVGYGLNGAGQQTGSRMVRGDLRVECQPGSCGVGVESTEFRGEDGACSGDSGGPALDENGKVVGVVSRAGPDCSTPVYGTVTAWQDFIVGVAKEAATRGGYEPPFWVTTGLSDPPAMPGGAGAGPGPELQPVLADAGDPCTSSASCGEGLACYSTSGSAEAATCVATCSTTAECSSGQVCKHLGSASVCLAASGSADDGGCSFGSTAKGNSGYGAWVVLGSLAALGGRRRKRPAVCVTGGPDAHRR